MASSAPLGVTDTIALLLPPEEERRLSEAADRKGRLLGHSSLLTLDDDRKVKVWAVAGEDVAANVDLGLDDVDEEDDVQLF